MTEEHRIILNAIEEALNRDPELRFGQALFNLSINQFVNPDNPAEADYRMRDIHGDKDSDIIARIGIQQEWRELQQKIMSALEKPELNELGGMTVNERLYATGLMDDFDKYNKSNKRFAQFILERLKVDRDSIDKILK
ncbi:hypothetical protein [Winogradskyella haliclonae]|uniref:Uncharacterized protein n=1 Tax=Winogradskyella haliclonae TaxID=2048558 RepID=A0ABQ2BWM8_9FLAO|nr:hypothetical protein [Winogradskyella haliclonae]GGI56867.1 hypothetical protein GCM10011444_11760 [Winogradskyella haliclonae]